MSLSRADIERIVSDPLEFCSRLSIIDKRGRQRKLMLNDEQVEIIESLKAGDDVLICKARQIGSSTAVAAYFFWRWYTAPDPETYVVLSHKLASSKHLLKMHKFFYVTMPAFLKRPLSVDNTTDMTLADTGATLMAASAGGDGGLRSFTATGLHISEFAFSENADELKATAISALNGNQLVIESTANFYGDPLHREYQLWEAELVGYNFLFFPWTKHKAYTEEPPDGFELDPYSDLTPGQQYWMAVMMGKLGETKFRREYPRSVEEAYAQVDGAWMGADILANLTPLQMEVKGGALAKVDPRDKYAIGVDVGAGTGGDNSAIVVISASTWQVVDIRRSNSQTPSEWADVVADASRKWNNAKVLVESNGTWGGVLLTELKHMGIPLWKTGDGDDWTTNASTKPRMLEGVKDAILRGRLTQLDTFTIGELRSFKINDRGEAFCPRNGIHHGDTVIALALALQCVATVHVPNKPFLPEWITSRRVADARRQGAKHEHRRY